MAEKPKTNVDKFFEIYDADPALQARVQQAMDSYPGSLEIRDVMTEHVLLPVAEELGLPSEEEARQGRYAQGAAQL